LVPRAASRTRMRRRTSAGGREARLWLWRRRRAASGAESLMWMEKEEVGEGEVEVEGEERRVKRVESDAGIVGEYWEGGDWVV
jgi:hypothetical protein